MPVKQRTVLVGKVEKALARRALGRCNTHCAADQYNLLGDAQTIAVPIVVDPAKAEQLTTTRTKKRKDVEWLEPVALDCCEERLYLVQPHHFPDPIFLLIHIF